LTVAALIVGVRPMRSRKGARWAIFTIQDMTGIQEMLAFPESFAKLEQVLKPRVPLLLKVRVQVEESGTRLSLQEARLLEQLVEKQSVPNVCIRMAVDHLTEELLDQLQERLGAHPGRSPVLFQLSAPDGTVATLELRERVQRSSELVTAIQELCGAESIDVVM
jgi:DNA polymerase-3 subunit alpha